MEVQRSAAGNSVILLARVPCDTAGMAQSRKSRLQGEAAATAAPDDLYDYVLPPARLPGRPAPDDATKWAVKDEG